jgi:hypothetical protein
MAPLKSITARWKWDILLSYMPITTTFDMIIIIYLVHFRFVPVFCKIQVNDTPLPWWQCRTTKGTEHP